MQIAVIAGTSEATDFIKSMNRLGSRYEITAFTATEYGKEILKDTECINICGRLDRFKFLEYLKGFDVVADLSHPFAEIVSENVKYVCNRLDIPYFRAGRTKSTYTYEKVVYVQSKEEALEYLKDFKGRIFLTTGINTLGFYENGLRGREEDIYARILDIESSRKLAMYSKAHHIYGIPPFTEHDTYDILDKFNIDILVSKDSGQRGGVEEKIKAAEKLAVPVLLISSPERCKVKSVEDIVNEILEMNIE